MDLTVKYINYINDPASQPTKGLSKPFLITASDNKEYFLKNEIVYNEQKSVNDYEDAVFFQELLCHQLAIKLNVPVPDAAIIEISQDYLDHSANMVFKHRVTKPGLYFATAKLPGIDDNLIDVIKVNSNISKPNIKQSWKAHFSSVENKESYISIIAFDLLIANFDRFGNLGNLVVSTESNHRNAYAIDFGHSFFGPFYSQVENLTKIQYLTHFNKNFEEFINQYLILLKNCNGTGQLSGLGKVFVAMADNLSFKNEYKNPFIDIIARIESITAEEIMIALDNIPEEWITGGTNQKQHYKNFLMDQKYLVKNIINEMNRYGAFSNSTSEGDLSWPKERTIGIQ